MDPIWQGGTDERENVAQRTPIIVTPAVGQYSSMEPDAPQRVANWQA